MRSAQIGRVQPICARGERIEHGDCINDSDLNPSRARVLRLSFLATIVRVCWRSLPLVALCFASGCEFDSHPSLGWDKHSELHRQDASERDADVRDAGFEVDGDVDASGEGQGDAGLLDASNASDASDVTDVDNRDASADTTNCPTGLYVGQFECRLSSAPVGTQFEIDFTLERSSPDSSEATAEGPILFGASGALMVADLRARLDCTTGAFHADLANGVALTVPIPVLVPFVGSMDGEIDEAARVLAGEWRFALPPGSPFGSLGTCEGTWRAPLPR